MHSMILPGLYRVETGKPSCLSYLVKTPDRNILLDPGVADNFELLADEVLMCRAHGHDVRGYKVDLWL
ncbi:MAG: hypothetical protein SV686_01820, partial [Thermodesulfobacteriota bacterium]|nr:hypothetical protein [Thermodesulfobacteriota bacterium]